MSGRSQAIVVDGSLSASVYVVSGVPQGSVLSPLLFLVYTSEQFSFVSNTLVGYADDTTFRGVVPTLLDHTSFTEALKQVVV